MIVDEVDGALGGGGSMDGNKGVGMIVEYLKKCINYTENKTKKKNGGDDDDEDDDLNNNDKEDKNKEDEKDTDGFKVPARRKKRDDGIRELKRPIIFICNDLYSKALLPLRDIALTVKIEESNFERLLSRLRFICKRENFKIDD